MEENSMIVSFEKKPETNEQVDNKTSNLNTSTNNIQDQLLTTLARENLEKDKIQMKDVPNVIMEAVAQCPFCKEVVKSIDDLYICNMCFIGCCSKCSCTCKSCNRPKKLASRYCDECAFVEGEICVKHYFRECVDWTHIPYLRDIIRYRKEVTEFMKTLKNK
jgi:hypothetical protein